jgi:ABC-2 type transport system permease protein
MKKPNLANQSSNPGVSLKTQYWLFKKHRANSILLFAFLLAGIYGLYQGFVFKTKQIHTIENFKKEKVKNLSDLLSGFHADTTKIEGKEAYEKATGLISSNFNIALPAYKRPTSTAIFSIGQADVFPYYYTVRTESFFMQLFKQGEIANPLRSLAGHFDTSFWIIYLLPLLIIILCFNSLSNELDNGNWALINSQGISKKRWLQSKFLLVGLIIETMVVSILIVGLIINYGYFNQVPTLNDFLFFVGANLYFIFWLSLVYGINSIGKSTSTNALYCGIIWTMVCVIIPTLTTVLIEKIVPVDNTPISRMSRRPQGSKFENDAFGIKTIKQFGETYAIFKTAKINPEKPAFKFAVYLAYHRLLDDYNTAKVKNYFQGIEKRQQFINSSCLFNPTAAIDGIFASLANNDAFANHLFVWQTKDLHDKLNDAYYPAVFFDRQVTKNDYDKFPVFNYANTASLSTILIIGYTSLGLLAVFVFVLSNKNLKKA